MLKVVLADRDAMYLQKLKNSLERKGNISVVGMTGNGYTALDLIKQHNADVLIMDILLGEKDGFWLLENIESLKLDCTSMIVSAIDGDTAVRKAISLGAEYYMAKPVQGDLLIERIYQLLGFDNKKSNNVHTNNIASKQIVTVEDASVDNRNRESEIAIILSRMGIPASIKGYFFIRTAVIMGLDDPNALNGITKGLYPDIGRLYETSGNKVERAIRHAVESGWKKNAPEVYFELVGCYYNDKPTNGQFIATLVEYFRMKDMKSA